MLVCILKNYGYPNYLRQFPSEIPTWNGIEFTFSPVPECDYLIVINKPIENISIKCRKGGACLIIQEPPYPSNNHYIKYFRYFDRIYSQFNIQNSKSFSSQTCLPWHIDKNYNELLELSYSDLKKKDNLSWITSNRSSNPGHLKRLKFLDELNNNNLSFDLYGRGFNEIDDKWNGLEKYKYTLAIENYSGNDYWTEKIADAYLSYCMPIYYGCENITDYFPEKSLLQIDIENPKEAIRIIESAIDDKLWEKNIDEIKIARELVLNKYQLFPFINNLIEKDAERNDDVQKKKYFIPKSGRGKVASTINSLKKYFYNLSRN